MGSHRACALLPPTRLAPDPASSAVPLLHPPPLLRCAAVNVEALAEYLQARRTQGNLYLVRPGALLLVWVLVLLLLLRRRRRLMRLPPCA